MRKGSEKVEIDRFDASVEELKTFFKKRITELRLKKGVSEIQMSSDLDKSRNYIHNLVSGVCLPQMAQFFRICEYFQISPIEFFDADIHDPDLLRQANDYLKMLPENELADVIKILKMLSERYSDDNYGDK